MGNNIVTLKANQELLEKIREYYRNDQILDAFPSGKVPPVEKTTLRTEKEMEPYLKEPFAEGWKSVYEIPMKGPFTKL